MSMRVMHRSPAHANRLLDSFYFPAVRHLARSSIALLIVNKDHHRLGLALNDAASFVAGQPIEGVAFIYPRELLR